VQIQPIRALSWRGGLLSDVAASITWASGGSVPGVPDNATPADVINLSFATLGMCTPALQTAIEGAVSRGVSVVAAAGNANDDVRNYAPANCEGVISVGASDRSGKRAVYSNYGEGIDISAPGGDLNVDGTSGVYALSNAGTTDPATDGYAHTQGTSVAAAHVTGAIARLIELDPSATPSLLRFQITGASSTKRFADGACDADPAKGCGSGIVQIAAVALTDTFAYTGAVQSWTVPAGITSVYVQAIGAAGGAGTKVGGAGARVQGTLAVTPGETLNIYVGGGGAAGAAGATGGWNGGGNGQGTTGSGGGGATDLRQSGTAVANRVIVAGGGGGGGAWGVGGGAGYPNSSAGQSCTTATTGCVAHGTVATQTTGGASGIGANTTTTASGGGGGGYFGGGASTIANASAPGGSSYTSGGVTSVTHTAGVNSTSGSHGSLSITTTVSSLAPTDVTGIGFQRSVDLAWTPWSFAAVSGYRVKWGTTSGSLSNTFDVLGRTNNGFRHTGPVFQVTNKTIASNVATLTTSAAHGLAIGDIVNVFGVDETFDGSFTVTAVPSTLRFSYARTATNLAATAVSPAGQAEKDSGLGYNTPHYYQIAAIYTDASQACDTACLSDYSTEISATPVFAKTTTFSYTGAAQTYTVPSGVTTLRLDAIAGGGGASTNGPAGGLGGRIRGTIAVTPGEVLNVYVGGAGQSGSSGGWNGGGNGQNTNGGGGGGASDIRRGGTAIANRVMVAGGGGGGGYYAAGGFGGGLTGGTSTYAGVTSEAGTQTSGNPLGVGAAGTTANTGGGGGGYWGGKSGATNGIGGGGGSGWAATTIKVVQHQSAYASATGNGQITISAQLTGTMSVPASLTAAPFQRSVDLQWTAPDEDSTTGYRIKWGTDPTALTNVVDLNAPDTTFRHQSTTPVAVTTKAVAVANVATLTTATAHGLAVGNSVVVQGVGSPFDGPVTVTAVTTTTFSYAVSSAVVASSAVSPTGLVQKSLSLPIGTTFYYKIAARYTDMTQGCGASCFSAYSAPAVSTTTVFSKSTTFDYTGAPQAYTVPLGVTWLQVDAYGAKGGTAANLATGGLGGRAQATIPVTPGETLFIYPGRAGGDVTGWNAVVSGNTYDAGWNGGGAGHASANAGGGGGATDIRRGISVTNKALTSNAVTLTTSTAHGFAVNSQVIVGGLGSPFDGVYTVNGAPTTTTFTYARTATNVASTSAAGAAAPANPLNAASLARRVVVAGGAGGGGYYNPGAAGGGLIGASSTYSGVTSTGGTQTSGNALGVGESASTANAGGGGGGHYGGTSGAINGIGGGGGSNWTSPSALSNSDARYIAGVTHWRGVRSGDGRLVISAPLASSLSIPGNVTGIGTQRRANLNWTPVDTDAVTGYRVLWGTSSGVLTNSFDVMDPTANGIVHSSTTVSTITNKVLTSNVATLTTSSAHGLTVGANVLVQEVDSTFDGSYTVTAATATTFSFAKTATNVTSQSASGIAQLNDSLTLGRTYYYQVTALYTDLGQLCSTRCLSDASSEVSVLIRFTTSTSFDYTGAPQAYTVPSGVTWLTVDARGGKGGTAANAGSPGFGGRVTSTIPVTAGETLFVFAGRSGGDITNRDGTISGNGYDAGWNGGGGGFTNDNGGGGGGASDVRRGIQVTNKSLTTNVATLTTATDHGLAVNNYVFVAGVGAPFDGVVRVTGIPTTTTFTYAMTSSNVVSAAASGALTPTDPTNVASLARRVIVAGGGGGGSYYAVGGAGGGLVGGTSVYGSSISYGGTQTSGNALGAGNVASSISNGGGGGGGYWGGGTFAGGNAGGGGGSSWVSPDGPTTLDTRSAVGTVHQQGQRNGNGQVYIYSTLTGTMPVPANSQAVGQLAQVALNWTPSVVDAATGYRIMWGTALGSLTNQIDVAGGSASSYVHTGLTVGTTYYYQIATKYTDLSQSCTTNCLSAFANVVYATPVFTADTVFSYTGAPQAYTVPGGVTWLQVDAQGAEGGTSVNAGTGGKGGRLTATVPVTSGETLFVFAGRAGGTVTNYDTSVSGNRYDAGWNGGGGGFTNDNGGGGGGASDIRRGIAITNKSLTSNVATLTTATAHGLAVSNQVIVGGVGEPFDGIFTVTNVTTTTFTYAKTASNVVSAAATGAMTPTDPVNAASLARRVIVAGGGGGGSYYAAGGAGGGLTAGNSVYNAKIGYGGTQSEGWALGQGRVASAISNGGGGGGGYWGGTTSPSGNVGGGGGSSWTTPDGPAAGDPRTPAGVTHSLGYRSGNGVLTIGVPTRAYPTGITATGLQGYNSVGWDDSTATGLTAYKLYGGTTPDPATLIATLAPGTSAYVDGGSSVVVTNKALTSNVATLTLPTGHGYVAGQAIRVQGVDPDFDGAATVTAVTSTTIRYAKVAPNVASAATTTGVVTPSDALQIGTRYYYRVSYVANGVESQKSAEASAVPVLTTDVTFEYSGAPETFIVPTGVTSMKVLAIGGEGGTSVNAGTGGKGGAVSATMSVTPGETLFVFAGRAGGTDTRFDGSVTGNRYDAGWNGGGGGFTNDNGGGGGGASDIRRGIAITNKALTSNVATLTTATAHGLAVSNQVIIGGVGEPFDGIFTVTNVTTTTFTYAKTASNVVSAAATGAMTPTNPVNAASLARRVIVAGGGGGGSYYAAGGAGGGLTAGNSVYNTNIGYGGTQSEGWALGQGRVASAISNGGGGGGGYWGGTTSPSGNVGGGGGSSWTSPDVMPISHLQGASSGNGSVVFTIPLTTSSSGVAAASGNRQVGLTWTANTGSSVVGYSIQGDTTPDPTTVIATIDATYSSYLHLGPSISIISKSLSANSATLTTSSTHGFTAGQSVVVSNVDSTFNGTFTITAVTSTTLRYAKTAANVAATSTIGTATVASGLTNGTTYYYRVAPIVMLNGTRVVGPYSSVVSAIPAATSGSTYSYTGAPVAFTVPAGVTWLQVDAQGAKGGTAANAGSPGLGGRVQASLLVTPGEPLFMFIGGAGGRTGTSYVAGWNGGGGGFTNANGGGGGGATDIRRGITIATKAQSGTTATITTSAAHGLSNATQVIVSGLGAPFDGIFTMTSVPSTTSFTYTVATSATVAATSVTNGALAPTNPANTASLTRRLIVGGGGGGGSYYAAGGAGGGLAGGNSVYNSNISNGGTQVNGNALGVGKDASAISNGGGGGGGYWGGTTFAAGNSGGGGGSSWTAADAAAVVHTQGYRSGDGQISLAYSVDTDTPSVVSVTSSVANGAYRYGSTIPIQVNFSEPVTVTGIPRLTLALDAGSARSTAVLDYTSGSGSSTLTFNYPIAVGDLGLDLDYDSTTALSLNGGSIGDRAGNAATLTLGAPASATSLGALKSLIIDADKPATPILLVADGTDSIILDWSNNTEPDLQEYRVYSCSSLSASSCSPLASYSTLSSVAAPTSIFEHVAVGRGITYYYYVTALDTRGNESDPSTIVSWTLPIPAVITTPSVMTATPTNDTTPEVTGTGDPGATITVSIDGVAQTPTVLVAGDGTYAFTPTTPLSAGDHVFTAKASVVVNGKTNSSGTSLGWTTTIDTASPRVSTITRFLPLASTTSSDSLTFRVVFDSVVTGVSAADFAVSGSTATVTSVTSVAGLVGGYGVTVSGGDLANLVTGVVGLSLDPAATVTDLAGNAIVNLTSLSTPETYTMDNNFPTATITASPTSIGGTTTATITFTLSRSSTDFAASSVTVGSGSLSSFAGSGTSYTATFTPSTGTNGSVTITVPSGSFTDINGLANSVSTGSITVDSVAPTFTNITSAKANGTYKAGEVIDITVTSSEAVTVTGTPTLTLETGATDRAATYVSGSGTTTLTFRYTVQAGDNSSDLDIASTSALALAGGTIRDAAGNNASLTLVTPGASGSLAANKALVIDTLAPNVPTSLALTPVGPTFVAGTLLSDSTNLTATASITAGQATGGTAELLLSGVVIATDATILVGDTSVSFTMGTTTAAGLQALITAGGSVTVRLTDAVGNVSNAGAAVGLAVDYIVPTVTITSSRASLITGQTATITFTLSEGSSTFAAGDITTTGGTLTGFTSTSSTVYTATFTPTASSTTNGVISVASGTFTDLIGNPNSAATPLTLTVDTAAPTVASVQASPTSGTYRSGAALTVTVTFNDTVNVTTGGGTPTLSLDLGTARSAAYVSGSGTNTLSFRYTTVDGDLASDLNYSATTALVSGGGTIRDASGNDAVLTLPALANASSLAGTSAVIVDTVAPSAPTALALTPVGGTVVANTLLASNTNMTATATITAGQATGGSARLYLGTSIIATDATINSGDTTVSFDLGVASAAALQAAVAAGGSVTVVLLDVVGNASPASTAVTLNVDYVVPTVTVATDRTSFVSGDTATLTFTVSEATTNFVSGDVTVTGGTLSGWTATSSTAYSATFTPNSGDGIAGSVQVGAGSLTDATGNPNTASNTLVFTIDTVRPTITAFTSTSADGAYKQGDSITITATTSESVKAGAAITVTLDTGATVTLTRATAGTILTGTYTVGASQTTNDLTVTSFTIGGVQDASGNAMTATTVPSGANNIAGSKAIVVDSLAPDAPGAPVLTAVGGTTPPANTLNGTNTNMTATATITANQAVGGSAQLRINGVVIATDATILTGETGVSFTMGAATAAALQTAIAGGGSVTVVAIDAAGNISTAGAATTLTVDYTAPTATITSSASALKSGETATLTITLSESATDLVSGDLSLSGGTITSFTGSGTSYTAVFTPTANTASGTATSSVPTSRFTDANGNANTAASNTISIAVDNVVPTVSSASIASSNGTATQAKAGNTITVTLATSENVTIAGGTPSIPLTLGSSIVNATYVSGSGTNSLVFRYTVVTGDADTTGGIGVGVLAANGATLTDAAGNTFVSTFTAPTNAIVVDTTAPAAPIVTGTSPVNVGTATPTISGTAEAGATVRVYDTSVSPVALLGTVTAGGGGAWSITSTSLLDGDHAVSATATDPAGNLSADATAVTWRVDLTAPAAPVLNTITDDTGRSSSDRITNDTTITVIGTAEAGSTIQLYSGGVATGSSVTANASGAWIATTGALSAGAATLTAKATDAAGNTSVASTGLVVTIDTTAPTAPVITAPTTPSSNSLPTLAGTTTSNEIIAIYDGGSTLIGTAVANNAGAWVYTLTSSLLEGSHSFTATGTDVAGNTSTQGSAVAYVVDTTPPTVTLGAITGNNDITYVEKTNGVTIAGTVESGATVAVKILGSAAHGTVTYPTATTWAYVIDATDWTSIGNTSPIPFEITASDALGNATVISRSVTANLASLAVPGAPSLAAESDSGTRDFATNLSTVTVNVSLVNSGALQNKVGQVLDLLDGSGYVIATHTLVAGDISAGTYAFTLANQADGTYDLAARISEAGTAVGSSTGSYVIDTRPVDAPGTPDLTSGSDSGVSSSDNLTNVSSAAFTVSISSIQISASGLVTGDQVRLLVDGSVVDTVTLGGSIPSSLTFSSIVLTEGAHSITAVAYRPSNSATSPNSSSLVVTVDRTGGATTSAPDLLTADDTGSSSTDNITSIPQPRLNVSLSGTAAAGDQVKILDGATVLGTATVSTADVAAGSITVALTTSLAEGVNSLTARLDDRAGNVGTSSSALSVTLVTALPSAPTPSLASASDSGTTGDRVTNDTTPTISGTGTNGQVITLYSAGVAIGTATVSGGAWSITPGAALAAGQRSLTVTATDTAGNVSNSSAPLIVTIDATAPALPVVSGIAVDSGTSSSDGITNDSDISISGTAEAGSTITVTWSGGTRTTTADATGAWSIASTGTLTDGSYSFSTVATDAAGNVSSAAATNMTIDTVAPVAPAVTSPAATRTNPPAISGTGVTGSTVTIYDGPTLLGTTTVSGGTWTFTPGSALSEGTHAISATQSDAAGNISSASASLNVTIDTTAPAVPAVEAQTTNTLTPTITGTGVAGSTITLYRSGVLLNPSTSVTVNSQGVWTYAATFGATGVQLVAASAADALGNTSNTSADASIVIDQTAPAAPVISGSPISSNSATPTVTGTAEANATVKLYVAALLIGETTANGAGAWSVVTSTLSTGSYVITAKATDAAANTSASSAAASLIVDTTPPAAPTMNAITTYSLTQALAGTAEAGATVKVYDGTTLVGTTVADSSGNWSLTTSNLGAGAHSLTAIATDPAGNTGVASSPARTISATYAEILGAADGTDNNQLAYTASQYAADGLTQIDNAAKAGLLNDVLDAAAPASVDTRAELSALADTVAGVLATAAGQTASPALTPEALAAIGLTGVTSSNLADVIAAIAATADNGSGADTFTELSSVVANAVAAAATRDDALAIISAYTGSNTAPTVSTYTDAQVTGVTSGNIASINTLIAVMTSTATDTTAEVQAAVDAYTAVLAAADGLRNNSAQLVASQYAAMGMGAIDTAADLALMNRILDTATTAEVDTAAELYALGNVVTGIMTAAAGGTTTLTAADFALIGLTGVTSANLASVLGAIAASADDGTGVDSLVELQALVDQIVASALSAALAVITGYNGTNTAPTANDYSNAGVTGVDATNLAAINSVIATAATSAKDSTVEVQVIVNAYSDLLAGADGDASNNNVSVTASQYALLGVTAIDSSVKASLMNDVIDGSARTAVDTQAELITIASVIDRLFILAGDGTPSPALTAADFSLLGITGVTTDNLPAILAALAATADDGSGIDTFAELQSAVTSAATAASSALNVISSYTGSNTAPTVANFESAGVTGVEAGNLSAINSVIGPLTAGETDTRAEVQAIVDAYSILLAAADGVAGTGGTLTAAQFQALGITSINTTSEALLMSLVADTLTVTQIDSKTELVALASIVDRLMTVAAGGTASPPLTAADLAALGIPGVNASNLAGILAAIAATADNGSGIDTFAELSSVVAASVSAQEAQSLAIIAAYTGSNTAPTVDNFTLAQVTGVNSGNLNTINSAIAPLSSAATDSTVEVQTIVDAYLAVLVVADGNLDNDPAVTQAQFTALGLTAIDNAAKVNLLNQVLDSRPASAVDTYTELANLASIVARIVDAAAGITPSPALTAADFAAIGISGVTAYNVDQIVAGIIASADNGSDVDTVNGLSSVADAAIAQAKADAIATIAAYDGTNTAPTIGDFANAEVTGVTFVNLGAINSIVAVRPSSATDSTLEIQAIVDAYAAILTAADGNAAATSLSLSATEYATIGLATIDDAAEVALMNSVLSGRTNAQVDTYAELAEIARVVEALVLIAAGGTPSSGITLADLALLGITGVDATNLDQFLTAIAASGSDGSGIDSLTKLQAISNQVNTDQDAALARIAAYDGTNTAPSLATFIAAGVTGVDASNLAGINSFLATMAPSITDSIAEIQALVDAFMVLAPGVDGIDNDNVDLTLAQWRALGFVEALTSEDVLALNDLFDTIDWTVAVDAGAATTDGQAALAALRIVVSPRSGEEPAPDAAVRPSLAPAPIATATAAPAATATAIPVPTRKPVVRPTTSRPVYEDAPTPGDGIPEVRPGEIAVVVNGEEQRAGLEIVNDVALRVTLPQGVILQVSSILTDGKPAKVASDGALLVVQGTSVGTKGSGYRPDSLIDLTIFSTPTRLGTVTVEADGSFEANFPIPAGIEPGDHTIKIDGTSANGELTTVSVGLRVLPKSQEASVDTVKPSPTATNTAGVSDGSGLINSTTGVVLGAVLLLLLLGFFLIAARRRRSASH